MQKKTISAILFLLLTVMMLSGCGGGREAQDQPVGTFIPTGTEGVVVQFVQDQPPARLYTGTDFTVLAEVRNRGTYDVQNVDVFISGFDPNIIQVGTGRKSVTDLSGKSTYNPEGDIDTVEFDAPAIRLPTGTPSYKPNVMLSTCFLYETIASPMACVDPNPQYLAEDKACTVTNLQTGGSQGAPLAITSIESQATPNDMVFRIHISNVGGGQLFDKGNMQNCPFELQYSDLDKVYLEDASLGTGLRPTECKPSNPIRLVNGQATIFCKFAQPGGPAFQTPLNLRLAYGYKDSVQKQIEVQNIDQ